MIHSVDIATTSCRVNMTVLLSFEEKTDDARARAHNRDTVPLTSYISLYNEPLFSGHL